MRKRYLIIALVSIASLALTACGPKATEAPTDLLSAIKQRGYILVSTDADYAPQSFLNAEGKRPSDTKCPADALTTTQMQGFDVEVAKAVGNDLGVETCFTTPGWDNIAAGSWADKWDISVGSMTITTARQKLFDFSVPYYYTPAVVAVRIDYGFKSLDDLAGKALCVGSSSTYETWLNHGDLGPNITVHANAPDAITVIPLATDQECAKAIVAGREDFVGYVTAITVVYSNLAESMPVAILGTPVFDERLAAAFDKASSLPTDTLRAEVDKLFTQMHSDGTLSEFSKNWFKDANGQAVDYTVESK